ncbi:MAG TPA: glycoside hydrolase family 2 TIM barrel-domain containing protein [Chthonomonadaceae bacterium]|nr:glycoside hydrolase family 2 TIM barrel-domain containing protein [Chthonomonadaceae bacterium]
MRTTFSLNGADWQIMGLPPTEWVWRRIGQAGIDLDRIEPAAPPWIPAIVPGDVPSDLRDAGEIPAPEFGRNSRACEWVSQRDWVYRKEFVLPPQMQGRKRVRLCFGGVDYSCHVFLNGQRLGDHSGMYDPFAFDVTALLRTDAPNQLVVVIDHAPPEPDNQGQIGWTNQIRLWKARFAYGWDWCTRLIPLGIWQDVTLEADDGARIDSVWVRPILSAARDSAAVTVQITLSDPLRGRLSASVRRSGEDSPVAEAEEALAAGGTLPTLSLTIERPALWYPNGYGDQPLYKARIALTSESGETLDERTVRFGIRAVRFVPNDNAPADALPYVLEVNDQRVFMKGWNWAPIDQLYGRPQAARYRHWIRMAQEAHCNVLRVWGGGLLERELFYDLCDEAGILVWQEFIQSSSGIDNEPATDDAYIAYCLDQAVKMIPQRRNHPSLFLWCGGNELMTPDGTPLGNDHPTLAALRAVVEELHPDALFLPTSPSGPVFSASPDNIGRMHDVHGHWKYLGDPGHYVFFNAIDPLLHSEFGVEGAANLEAFPRFLPADAFWPPDRTNPDWVHHGAWWLNRPQVEALFGPLEYLEGFINASQWIQAEGLRYAIEASRRRAWRTSGTLPWQFNEAWPNASCTNALDYYGQPRPAYWTIRNAYAPYLVSAQYDRLAWKRGETFRAVLWLNASRPLPPDYELAWAWRDVMNGQALAGEGIALERETSGERSIRMGEIAIPLPETPSLFALDLRLRRRAQEPEETLARNTYLFSTHTDAPFAPLLRLPGASLAVGSVGQDRKSFTLDNDRALLGVRLRSANDTGGPYLSEGYAMYVPPGNTWRVRLSEPGRVRITAWNAPPLKIDTRAS